MVEIKLDDKELKDIYIAEVQKRLDNLELETMLMDSKQLCKMLSLSYPTVEKTFLRNPKFPKIRVGSKWLFNRKEVQEFIDRWSIDNKLMDGKW